MKNFVVVVENSYSTRVIFSGTEFECIAFIEDHPECDCFVQELDDEYCVA